MGNPYASPQADLDKEPQPDAKRGWDILVFCVTAYTLHVLALWGIACFHDAHIGSELREPFKAITHAFGWTGLLGVALVYAMAPAGLYGLCLSIVNHYVQSNKMWSKAMSIVQWSLGPTLVADGVLGLPLFTTG